MNRLDGASQRTYYTPRASLCALGALLQRKEFFRPLVQEVQLGQKVIKHQPLDKVKAAFIGMLAGISGLYQTDRIVRADVAVQAAFGLQHCAQQATIHDTLHRFESETVMQLRGALNQIFQAQSRACQHLLGQEVLILDLDLSAELTSKYAEQATKGYFPGHRNAYGRQHSRILAAPYDEIVAEHLYPGNTKLAAVMAHALHEAEQVLHLTPEQRSQVVIRTDSAGGAEEQINWLLAQGYQVHLKLYSWKRAAQLARSVAIWRPCPDHPTREVGLIYTPSPFKQPTIQIAVRSAKAKGGWSYHVVVSSLTPEQIIALVGQPPAAASDAEAIIQACADLYDDRSGPIEHSFGENHQALPLGQRHRRRFVVQEALLLLLSLAANTLVWLQAWIAPAYPPISTWGLLRLSRDLLHIPGCVTVDATGRIVQIQFNALDPLAMRLVPAWQRLLHPYAVAVETISLESLQPHRSALGDFGRN